MNLLHIRSKNVFSVKKAVKLITGLNNVNLNRIVELIKASEISKANYINIVANPEIVVIVKSLISIPICVLSINPMDLYISILAGANMAVIGNFDCLYNKGIAFSSDQIFELAKEIISLLLNSIICVTISHALLLYQQIQFVLDLKFISVHGV